MKNKFILSLILGIFLIGLVSAGITGYVLELRKGVAPVTDDNLGKVAVQGVSGDTATFTFANPTTGRTEILSGTAGQTLTTSSGVKFEVANVQEGGLFRKARAGVNVLPQEASPVAGIAMGIGANSCDGDSICEVAKTVSTVAGSTSALILTSDVKKVIVDGSFSAGSVFINDKTISTVAGSTSALILTSDVKKVIVDGSFSATNLAGTGNAYACVDSSGNLYRSLTACK